MDNKWIAILASLVQVGIWVFSFYLAERLCRKDLEKNLEEFSKKRRQRMSDDDFEIDAKIVEAKNLEKLNELLKRKL